MEIPNAKTKGDEVVCVCLLVARALGMCHPLWASHDTLSLDPRRQTARAGLANKAISRA